MTILDAHVPKERWTDLKDAFVSGPALPPPLAQTFLLQDAVEPTRWNIVSHWRSRESLEEYLQSVETPGGVLMFQAAGVEPTLSKFDVHGHDTA